MFKKKKKSSRNAKYETWPGSACCARAPTSSLGDTMSLVHRAGWMGAGLAALPLPASGTSHFFQPWAAVGRPASFPRATAPRAGVPDLGPSPLGGIRPEHASSSFLGMLGSCRLGSCRLLLDEGLGRTRAPVSLPMSLLPWPHE